MFFPPSITTEMRVPSIYFRKKDTGRIGKAYEPHPNGTHLRFEGDIRWYSLDDLEPASEQDYQDQITQIKQARTEEEYKKVLESFKLGL
jgi:hypothetical protein